MTKRTKNIIEAVVGALQIGAIGVVSAIEPANIVAINTAIASIADAIMAAVAIFVKPVEK